MSPQPPLPTPPPTTTSEEDKVCLWLERKVRNQICHLSYGNSSDSDSQDGQVDVPFFSASNVNGSRFLRSLMECDLDWTCGGEKAANSRELQTEEDDGSFMEHIFKAQWSNCGDEEVEERGWAIR